MIYAIRVFHTMAQELKRERRAGSSETRAIENSDYKMIRAASCNVQVVQTDNGRAEIDKAENGCLV